MQPGPGVCPLLCPQLYRCSLVLWSHQAEGWALALPCSSVLGEELPP